MCPRIGGDEPEQGEHDQLDLDEDGNLVVDRTGTGLAAVDDVAAELADGPLHGLRVERAARPAAAPTRRTA